MAASDRAGVDGYARTREKHARSALPSGVEHRERSLAPDDCPSIRYFTRAGKIYANDRAGVSHRSTGQEYSAID